MRQETKQFKEAVDAEMKRLSLKHYKDAAFVMKATRTTLSNWIRGTTPIGPDQQEALERLRSATPEQAKALKLGEEGPSYRTSPPQTIRLKLKDGTEYEVPVPPGPGGLEEASKVCLAIQRAQQPELDLLPYVVQALRELGLGVASPGPVSEGPAAGGNLPEGGKDEPR